MKKKNNIYLVLYAYWAVLLLWQNVRSAGNRGTMDILIKIALLLILIVAYLYHASSIRVVPFFFFFTYVLANLILFYVQGGLTFSNLLYYFYPCLMFLLVYSVGGSHEIDKKQLIHFLNLVILLVAYAALYAVFFQSNKFFRALSLSSAYGNELTSFFFSNYEYGVYLAYATISAIICLEIDKSISPFRRLLYLGAICLFVLNLILTFSRTAIISFVILLVLCLVRKNKGGSAKFVFLLTFFAVVFLITSPTLRDFFKNIVFKDNAQSARPELIELGIRLFGQSNLFDKIFGNISVGQLIEELSEHSNLHNGYLMMLLTNGLKGVAFLAVIVIAAVRTVISTKAKTEEERLLKRVFIGFVIGAGICMMTATSTLFYSSIDSFFLSLYAVIVPKYVCNSIRAGTFDN